MYPYTHRGGFPKGSEASDHDLLYNLFFLGLGEVVDVAQSRHKLDTLLGCLVLGEGGGVTVVDGERGRQSVMGVARAG